MLLMRFCLFSALVVVMAVPVAVVVEVVVAMVEVPAHVLMV